MIGVVFGEIHTGYPNREGENELKSEGAETVMRMVLTGAVVFVATVAGNWCVDAMRVTDRVVQESTSASFQEAMIEKFDEYMSQTWEQESREFDKIQLEMYHDYLNDGLNDIEDYVDGTYLDD